MGAAMANLQEERQHRRRDRNHAECGHPHRKVDVGAGRSALPRIDKRRPTDHRQIPREHQPHWLPRGAFDSRLHVTLAPSTKLPTISIAPTMAAYRRFIGQILGSMDGTCPLTSALLEVDTERARSDPTTARLESYQGTW